MTYTEGILGDGAAILKDGVMVPIEEVVSSLNDMERYREALEQIAKVGVFDAFDDRTPKEVAKEALLIA